MIRENSCNLTVVEGAFLLRLQKLPALPLLGRCQLLPARIRGGRVRFDQSGKSSTDDLTSEKPSHESGSA